MTGNALKALINHSMTKQIEIDWKKENINFKPYKKWIELWKQN
jgi:hypothetical protein